MLAQLNLDEYFVDEISVKANTNYIEDEVVSGAIKEPEFFIQRNSENGLKFLVSMTIDVNREREDFEATNYQIHVKINGFFSFVEGTDEEMINKMIAPSGLSILYGVARGVVAQFTANCRYGKFLLPSLNISAILKAKANAEKITAEVPAVKKARVGHNAKKAVGV
jgi:preprotein translocase subunit SecB